MNLTPSGIDRIADSLVFQYFVISDNTRKLVGGLRNYGMTTFTKCEAKGCRSTSELGDLKGEKRVLCAAPEERENNSRVMIAPETQARQINNSKIRECPYRWRKRARSYNMPTFAVRFAVKSPVRKSA